jgi:hypothetical protein
MHRKYSEFFFEYEFFNSDFLSLYISSIGDFRIIITLPRKGSFATPPFNRCNDA